MLEQLLGSSGCGYMKAVRKSGFHPRKIHETAIVHPLAKLGRDVEVGPYSVIGEDVVVGDGTRIGSHVEIIGPAMIGGNCKVCKGAVIGAEPQDVKYAGEKTGVIIGDNNIIKEYVTISRGTPGGRGTTIIGDDNMIMAYAHVAHDCVIGNGVVITGGAALAGHVAVEDRAVIGGMSGVHQFVRVGSMAMVGGMAKVVKDVPPYFLVDGNPARVIGVNIVGLRRNGLSLEVRAEIRKAYRILYSSGLNLHAALERIKQELANFDEIGHLVEFLESSSRGICSCGKRWEDQDEEPEE